MLSLLIMHINSIIFLGPSTRTRRQSAQASIRGETADAKLVVWAHNSHVGDARAQPEHTTGLRATVLGDQWSLGHLW